MATRLSALKRIEGLYSLIETMHAATLEQAAGLMHEAERAIAMQSQLKYSAHLDAQAALRSGDSEGWAVSELQRQHSDLCQQRLEPIREERERLTAAARAIYTASRIQRGQIKTVVDKNIASERLDHDRRAQSAADDRFLSRLRWNGLEVDSAGVDGA